MCSVQGFSRIFTVKNVLISWSANICQADIYLNIQGVISKIFAEFDIYFIQGVFTNSVTAGRTSRWFLFRNIIVVLFTDCFVVL